MPPPSTSERVRFEEIFDAHEVRVRAFVLRRLREVQDAEDVVAETFAIAWRRIGDVPPEALPWLYVTARLVLANHRGPRGAGARSSTRLSRRRRSPPIRQRSQTSRAFSRRSPV